jgi:hypothetical protein
VIAPKRPVSLAWRAEAPSNDGVKAACRAEALSL